MEEEIFGANQATMALDRSLDTDQCSNLFSSPAELNTTQGSHKEERPYKCSLCDKSYRHAGSLVNHKKTHQIGLYTCLICQKEFSNPMGLKSHLRTHSEDKRFKCDQCGEAFRMSQQLYNHRRSSHTFSSISIAESLARNHVVDVQAPILVDSSNLISNLENYIAESMVPGDFSQVAPKYYQDGNSAEEPANDDALTQQGSMEDTREEQAPNDNTEEYRYKCNQCEKAYKHPGSLANHRQSHMVGLYQCAICFKEFSNLMAMKNHCRLHSDSRTRQRCKSPRYSAKIGGPLLENADTLQKDILYPKDTEHQHEDLPAISQVSESSSYEEDTEMLPSPTQKLQDDLHPDSLCSEQALQSPNKDSMMVEENAVDHNSTFTSEEETCQQSEQQQYDEILKEGKPEDSENRPFRCQDCGKTYRHAGSLINHKKTHQTGVYSCPLCSKQMFNVAALNNHFRAHFKSRAGRKLEDSYVYSANVSDLSQNLEDSFQCRICGDYLTNENDFLQHQVIHQEEAIKETYGDTQNMEGALGSGTYWPEYTQVSQSNSDPSSHSLPNPVKPEMEDLAQQPSLHQWTHEETSTTPHDGTPQDNGAKVQDTSGDIEQLTVDEMVFKEESSPLEEHDESPVDRPYKCEPCGRTYRHKSSLINHRLTHKTGIYPCSLCPKQYSNLMALRNHHRFHGRSYAGRRGILSRRGHPYLRGRPRYLQNKTIPSLTESVKLNENVSPQTDEDTAVEETLTQISCSCGESFDCTESFQCHSQMCQSSTSVSCSTEPPIDLKKEEQLLTDPLTAYKTIEKQESPVKLLEASEHQGRRVYECDLCNKSYRHSGSLINHKRTHQTGDYMCPYCSRHVHNMAALKNHIRIHHKGKKSQPGEMHDSSRFLYPDLCYSHPGAKNFFGCVNCEEIFHCEEDLVAHQMVHMALEGDPWEQRVSNTGEDDQNLSLENVSDSEREHSNNSDIHGAENPGNTELMSEDYSNHIDYTCIECGEVYASIEDLNNHKLTHQIGIYQCSFCPKEYPNLPALREHFQSHTKPLALRNVVKDNSHGEELDETVQDQQAFDNCYDCGHCGLIFSDEVDFHQHQVAHEKQVKAESLSVTDPEGKEPEFSFPMDSSERELLRRIKSELEEAENTEAPDGGSQLSHICGYCGQTYDDLESLQTHSLSHSAEEKPLTNESINSEADNQDHNFQQTPTKEEEIYDEMPKNEESHENRPYTCDQCGKSYRHGGSLVNHKKTHLVGNFQCVACSKQYPNMAAYINHLRHHPQCKQHVALNSQHEPNASDLHDSPYTIREGGRLNFSSSATFLNASASAVLPSDFKPCIDTLSTDNSCFNHSNTQTNFQLTPNHPKLSRKRCLGQGEKRRDPVTGHSPEGGSTCQPDVDGKLFQGCEFAGKTVIGVEALSLHIAGNCEKSNGIEVVGHSEETIKAEEDTIPPLASINYNQNEGEAGYCGQTYDDLEGLQANSLSHANEEKHLVNESIHSDANHQDNDLQLTPAVKEEENSDESPKNEESQENRPYTCDQCGKSYRYGGSLVNHKKTHLVGHFQCVACSKQYFNMAAYINHLRHHPECKQHVAVTSQHELNASEPHDSPYTTEEGGHLNVSPSASLPNPSVSDVLPSDFKPCIDTLSMDNSCLDHSNTQINFHTPANHAKLSRKYPVTSTPMKAESTPGSDVDDKPFQTRELAGKTFFGVKSLSLRIAGNCENSVIELVRPSEETIKVKDEVSSLASSSRNEDGRGFYQRPFHCEVCGRSYRHAGSLINHKQTHKTGVFRCSICQKRFFNLMAMKNHNRIHFELKRHKCLDCGKAFRLRKQLDTHQRLHWQRAAIRKSGRRKRLNTRCRKFSQMQQRKITPLCEDITLDRADCSGKKSSDFSVKGELDPDSRPYQCEQCGRSYRHAGSLFNHKKSHKMGQYCCPICHRTYSNLMALKNHERNHYEAKRHHCLQCGKTFKWKRQLTRHLFVHAQEESQSNSQPPVERKASTVDDHQAERSTGFRKRSRKSTSPISRNSKKQRSYFGNNAPFTKDPICTACDVLFSSSDELRKHVCSESLIKMPNPDNEELGKTTLSKEDSERPYGCDVCGRTYRHAGSLLNHKNTHKKGLYKCSLCNKQFSNPMAIKNHLRTHAVKKKFQCVECGKAFRSSQKLVCHIRTHTGVGPFRCPICNREFSSKLTLRHHQRTHKKSHSFRSSSPAVPSDEETNICENTSDSCKVEPTQDFPPSQERKYKCNQCDRSYRHASSLFNHKKTHRTGVYKCPNCPKEFFNLMAYNNHLRIHKFPCEDCGKAFRIAGHLEAHRKIHEQEGAFNCSSFEHHQLTHNGPDNDVLEPQPISNLMVEVT